MHFTLTLRLKLKKFKFGEQETDFNKTKSVSFKRKKKKRKLTKALFMAVHSNILLCLQQTLFPHRFQAQVSFTSLVFLLRGLPSSGLIRSMASVYPSETHSYSQQTTEAHPASLCTYLGKYVWFSKLRLFGVLHKTSISSL